MTIEWGAEIEVDGVRPAWLKGRQVVDVKTAMGWRHAKETEPMRRPTEDWAWQHEDGKPCIQAIRLPADHWVYTVLRYNAEHGTNFVPWGGGNEAPSDWDAGEVLLRDGSRGVPPTNNWRQTVYFDDIIGYTRRAATGRFKPGDRVTHPEYGVGTVDSVTLSGHPCVLFDGRRDYPTSSRLVTFLSIAIDDLTLVDPDTTSLGPDYVAVKRMTESEVREAYMKVGGRGYLAHVEILCDLGIITADPTPLDRFMQAHPDADRATAELALGWTKEDV